MSSGLLARELCFSSGHFAWSGCNSQQLSVAQVIQILLTAKLLYQDTDLGDLGSLTSQRGRKLLLFLCPEDAALWDRWVLGWDSLFWGCSVDIMEFL